MWKVLAHFSRLVRSVVSFVETRLFNYLRPTQVAPTLGTIQKDLRPIRTGPAPSQDWATFLKTHAADTFVCDFLPVVDVFFRRLHLFFIVELGTRRVVHMGVAKEPTQAWVAQQWREATPYGQLPRFLIQDNDTRYGHAFEEVVEASGAEVIRTPIRAPRANAAC